jgi:hypothetical protein
MNKKSVMAAVLALATMGGYAVACDKDAAKTACGKRAATPEVATSVAYRVGDIETPCAKTAAAVAERDGLKVAYVAAGESFATEHEAKAALAKKIETAVAEMLQVRYAVDGECVNCPMTAAALAKKTGKPLKYLAVGHEFDSIGDAQTAITQAKAVLASHGSSDCCASGKSATLAKAAEGGNSSCCSSAKTAVASSSCSSGAKATVASAGSSCTKDAKATTVAGATSSCSSGSKATVASAGSSCSKDAKATTVAGATSSCSSAAKTAVASAGSSCSKDAKAATVAGATSSCSSAAKTAVASTCVDTEKADAALAAAKARYEAVLASVSNTGASQG